MDCKSEHISNLRLNIQVLWKEPQIFVSNHKTQKAQSLEVVLRPQSCAEASFKGRQPLQQTKQAQPLRLLLGLYEHAFAASKARKKERQPLEATCFPPPSCSIALLKRGPSCIWQWQGRGGSCFVVYMAQKCAHNIGPLLLNKPNPQHLEFTTTHRCSYKQEQPMAKRQRHAFYRMLSRVELKKGRSQQI